MEWSLVATVASTYNRTLIISQLEKLNTIAKILSSVPTYVGFRQFSK